MPRALRGASTFPAPCPGARRPSCGRMVEEEQRVPARSRANPEAFTRCLYPSDVPSAARGAAGSRQSRGWCPDKAPDRGSGHELRDGGELRASAQHQHPPALEHIVLPCVQPTSCPRDALAALWPPVQDEQQGDDDLAFLVQKATALADFASIPSLASQPLQAVHPPGHGGGSRTQPPSPRAQNQPLSFVPSRLCCWQPASA